MLAPIAAPNSAARRRAGVDEPRLAAASRLDGLLDPLGRQREVRLAREVAGKDLGAVDDDAGLGPAHRGERRLGAGDDEIAAEDQIGLARADPDRVDVLGARARS